MDGPLSLPALLSSVLVAFTIEFDNEAEQRMPHRTTNHSSPDWSLHAPWLVSLAMWSNCMQFIGEEGVAARELGQLARTTTNLNGMQRWGYIFIEPNSASGRAKPPRSDRLIRATRAGRKAQEVWRPLFSTIEERWQTRFGQEEIHELRGLLQAVAGQIEIALPDSLPLLGYGLFSRISSLDPRAPIKRPESLSCGPPLSTLLSKVLLAFALDFERDAEVSLAISANVLRLVGDNGVRVCDLPRLSGVSKEAIAVSLSFLQKHGYAVVEPESPGSRLKQLMLTARGRRAREAYCRSERGIEEHWRARFGTDVIYKLRGSLQQLVGEATAQQSPLFRGLEPYPDGWRASVPRPDRLPHYPVVSHRGGFPDGS